MNQTARQDRNNLRDKKITAQSKKKSVSHRGKDWEIPTAMKSRQKYTFVKLSRAKRRTSLLRSNYTIEHRNRE